MTATIPLPLHTRRGRCGEITIHGEAHCPYCGKRIGLEHRCPHLDDLLTPTENGGVWAVVVREEPFNIPVLKMGGASPAGDRGRSVLDRVRLALVDGPATDHEIRDHADIDSQGSVAAAIQRLRERGDVEVVAVRREPQCKRLTRVYGLTAAGRVRVAG